MNCENCIFFVFDEYYNEYSCTVNLDEDEMLKYLQGDYKECSYFKLSDEYGLAKKQ